jgi:hypothetical protein
MTLIKTTIILLFLNILFCFNCVSQNFLKQNKYFQIEMGKTLILKEKSIPFELKQNGFTSNILLTFGIINKSEICVSISEGYTNLKYNITNSAKSSTSIYNYENSYKINNLISKLNISLPIASINSSKISIVQSIVHNYSLTGNVTQKYFNPLNGESLIKSIKVKELYRYHNSISLSVGVNFIFPQKKEKKHSLCNPPQK